MDVARLEIGRREQVKTWLGRDSQVGPELQAAVGALVDDERSRGTRHDGHPLQVEREAPEMAQIEVVAHLRHQADAPVKQGGSGEGGGESGSAHVPGRAMRRPVRGEARVADQYQVGRARESVPGRAQRDPVPGAASGLFSWRA